MKKIALLIVAMAMLVCLLAVYVSAEECAHIDNWEVKLNDDGVFGEWEAINVCTECGIVLKDEFCKPLVESWGYSYCEGSFTQGFEINVESVEKYKAYTGKSFEYGVVAGVVGVVGNTPVNLDGSAASDKAVVFDLSKNRTEHFDIKIANVPSKSYGEKLIACAYIIDGGEVLYGDNRSVDKRVAGISYDEIVDMIDNGGIPQGFEEYRQLTAEEMDILMARYWMSNHKTEYNVRRDKDNDYQKFAATRMFTRDELPSGSYVVIGNGWSARPEVWKADEEGNPIILTGSRPGTKGAGTYKIESLWQDSADGESEYVYMAFNISENNGGYLENMTPEGIAQALQIYVPADTKVAKNQVEKLKNVSVEGMQLVEWTEENLAASRYWSNQYKASDGYRIDGSYYCTQLFTKETLPVGSVIEINGDWIYRAEYWINGVKTSPRGPMVTVYRFVVTEEFWDGISDRGFNISKIAKEVLSKDDRDIVSQAFKIYLPVD